MLVALLGMKLTPSRWHRNYLTFKESESWLNEHTDFQRHSECCPGVTEKGIWQNLLLILSSRIFIQHEFSHVSIFKIVLKPC